MGTFKTFFGSLFGSFFGSFLDNFLDFFLNHVSIHFIFVFKFLNHFKKDPDTVRGSNIDLNYVCLFNTIFYSVQKVLKLLQKHIPQKVQKYIPKSPKNVHKMEQK